MIDFDDEDEDEDAEWQAMVDHWPPRLPPLEPMPQDLNMKAEMARQHAAGEDLRIPGSCTAECAADTWMMQIFLWDHAIWEALEIDRARCVTRAIGQPQRLD